MTYRHYSIVGNNSVPNEEALYAGINAGTENDTDKFPLELWEKFASEGYVTLKAEDFYNMKLNMYNPRPHTGS